MTTSATPTPGPYRIPGGGGQRGYIWEVQGLRTVAALLVAVYHIWFERVSGGVDAFFVIAAFFMATSFQRMDRITPASVGRYWAATARRVCPGAATVIAVTMIGVVAFLPPMMWYDSIRGAAASTVFVENWWLAITGTDYLTKEAAKSPFQQMWALSLQMQYYAALPVVLLAASWLARRMKVSRVVMWNGVLGTLLLASLAYSVVMTERIQAWAYFDSLARGWEYMFGALLAVNIVRLPGLGGTAGRIAGYGALAVLVSFAAVLPVSSLFPGYAALVPVLATVAMIWVARSGTAIAPLRWKPLLSFAECSFPFYLWHWPLLVFWRVRTDSAAVGLLPGIGVIVVAGVLAWLTVRLFENPFRRWSFLQPRPALSLMLSALVLVPAVGAIAVVRGIFKDHKAQAYAAYANFDPARPQSATAGTMVPDPMLVSKDLPRLYENGCHQKTRDPDLRECSFGDPDAAKVVVLLGGSHSTALFPLFETLAKKEDFRLVTMVKSSCIYTTDPAQFKLDDPASCAIWNRQAEDRLLELDPDLVITIATRGRGSAETIPGSFKTRWRTLTDAQIPLLVLRDNPRFRTDQIRCASIHGSGAARCAMDRYANYSRHDPGTNLAMRGVLYVDTSDLYCSETTCPVVRDGILLYRDRHHLNRTFAQTLSPDFARVMQQALAMKTRLQTGTARARTAST